MKVFELIKNNKVAPPLKTYIDSILFYRIGQIAPHGSIYEVGVGGSTYFCMQLAEERDVPFHLCDMHRHKIDEYMHVQHYWHTAEVIIHESHSETLELDNTFAYTHIDGRHTYDNAAHDIQFSLEHLEENGIICLDDYMNSRHPDVTRVCHDMIHRGIIKMVFVGDISCWITKPEYHEFWIENIHELEDIGDITGIVYNDRGKYYSRVMQFMNDIDLSAWNNYDHHRYLKMPYQEQQNITRDGVELKTLPPPKMFRLRKKT